MISDALFLTIFGSVIALFVGIVGYFWIKESSDKDFFVRNPLHTFWDLAPFRGLSRNEFDLYGVDRVRNDFSGVEAALLKEGSGKVGSYERPALANREGTLQLEGRNYVVQFPVQFDIDTRLIIAEKTIASLRASGFGSSQSTVTMDTGEQIEIIPVEEFQQNKLFESTVKKWVAKNGETLAVSYRPSGNRESLVRVLAIKQNLDPKLRDTIKAFFHV
jgi:hypothetical protein